MSKIRRYDERPNDVNDYDYDYEHEHDYETLLRLKT
jgi:hypothetical protein